MQLRVDTDEWQSFANQLKDVQGTGIFFLPPNTALIFHDNARDYLVHHGDIVVGNAFFMPSITVYVLQQYRRSLFQRVSPYRDIESFTIAEGRIHINDDPTTTVSLAYPMEPLTLEFADRLQEGQLLQATPLQAEASFTLYEEEWIKLFPRIREQKYLYQTISATQRDSDNLFRIENGQIVWYFARRRKYLCRHETGLYRKENEEGERWMATDRNLQTFWRFQKYRSVDKMIVYTRRNHSILEAYQPTGDMIGKFRRSFQNDLAEIMMG